MKFCLEDNGIKMYSRNNEGKFVFAERFIRTIKKKVYKYMNSVSKNVYIHKLDDIVNKYSNTYNSTIKIKTVDVNSSTYGGFDKVGDYTRISKYESIFAKFYILNWSEKFFVIKKFKNYVLWKYVISDPNGKEIVETFYKKESEKRSKKT